MDRISHLPDFIIHHILSFLDAPPTELVRMSVLSNTWFDLTASFPLLDFFIDDFPSRECFFKYVEYTTSRFCHHNLPAHTFKLITNLYEPAEVDIVNRCLELLLKNGVRELVIDITNSSESYKYRLPDILLSVSVLKMLSLHGCELPSSLVLDAVKFKSLIKLKLQKVRIDDEEVIKHLATSCPLLQVFRINSCYGFKRFCVYGHQHLQRVRITYHDPIEIIDIDAPNLSDLFVADWNGIGTPQMNLASCKKLTTVTYVGLCLPNSNGFTDFLSNFPFIENLYLWTKYKFNNLKVSSNSLRKLVLHSVCDLEEIELSAPNLVLYGYSCNYSSFWALRLVARHSTQLKACMQCYPDGYIDSLWFQKLRQFLDKPKGFKVLNLYIDGKYSSQDFTELEMLRAIELPHYELEHVELQLESYEESSAHLAFVDAVLWYFRPRSLTLRSSFSFLTDFEDVVTFTYEKLLEQEDHGLTNVQIVWPSSSSSESQKNLRNLKSLSMALPREGKAISFIKEEVVLEEAG